jgi:hypothetical protein
LEINKIKALSFEDLSDKYKLFLNSQYYSKTTNNTYCSGAFYLWKKKSKNLFWKVVSSTDFDRVAKKELFEALSENSSGKINSLVISYMSYLRNFCLFLSTDGQNNFNTSDKQKDKRHANSKGKIQVNIPTPSSEQVDLYLKKWMTLENYKFQEEALNKIFFQLCPKNKNMADILLKASALNNFYSTNIFSIYPVAKHIQELNVDSRLEAGKSDLVADIQSVTIGDKKRNFYSFATKYCSHHNPSDYPIYDNYVDKILRYFRDRDNFSNFKNSDLKDYKKFKRVYDNFKKFYKLDGYKVKQIDQYIWQLGKEYFKINYNNSK